MYTCTKTDIWRCMCWFSWSVSFEWSQQSMPKRCAIDLPLCLLLLRFTIAIWHTCACSLGTYCMFKLPNQSPIRALPPFLVACQVIALSTCTKITQKKLPTSKNVWNSWNNVCVPNWSQLQRDNVTPLLLDAPPILWPRVHLDTGEHADGLWAEKGDFNWPLIHVWLFA